MHCAIITPNVYIIAPATEIITVGDKIIIPDAQIIGVDDEIMRNDGVLIGYSKLDNYLAVLYYSGCLKNNGSLFR